MERQLAELGNTSFLAGVAEIEVFFASHRSKCKSVADRFLLATHKLALASRLSSLFVPKAL